MVHQFTYKKLPDLLCQYFTYFKELTFDWYLHIPIIFFSRLYSTRNFINHDLSSLATFHKQDRKIWNSALNFARQRSSSCYEQFCQQFFFQPDCKTGVGNFYPRNNCVNKSIAMDPTPSNTFMFLFLRSTQVITKKSKNSTAAVSLLLEHVVGNLTNCKINTSKKVDNLLGILYYVRDRAAAITLPTTIYYI